MREKSRAPAAPERKAALTHFAPVPRKCPRHDGWTPERQRGFIAALADTGCVKVAARMVNMAHASAYQLRREPGAEAFRAAWDAAQSLGLQVVKDEAFDRALNGQLVPVFVGGKLMGFRRKKNDRLLMFILRHYGQDAAGRKTTINYFSTRASAGAAAAPLPLGEREGPAAKRWEGEGMSGNAQAAAPLKSSPSLLGEGDHAKHGGGAGGAAAGALAESSTTTVKTVITGPDTTPLAADDEAAALLNAFEGIPLDEEAKVEIARALAASAERHRALRPDRDVPHDERLARQEADPECHFIRVKTGSVEYLGELESGAELEDFVPFVEGEQFWESIGEPVPEWFAQWEAEQAEKAKAPPAPGPSQSSPSLLGEGDQPKPLAKAGGGAGASAPEEMSPRSSAHPEPVEGPAPPPTHPEALEGPAPPSAHSEALLSAVEPKATEGQRPGRRTPKRSRKRTPKAAEPDPDDPRADWRNWQSGEYVGP